MSGSALMDALSDPGVNTLAGMAQGFAQAAMPTRMPTPIGAVLGMGAGGMMQGAGNAQRMQAQQQQIQGARMQNIATASGLPLTVARNQALTNIWQNPDLLQSMTNGSPMGAPPAGQGGPPPRVPRQFSKRPPRQSPGALNRHLPVRRLLRRPVP